MIGLDWRPLPLILGSYLGPILDNASWRGMHVGSWQLNASYSPTGTSGVVVPEEQLVWLIVTRSTCHYQISVRYDLSRYEICICEDDGEYACDGTTLASDQ